MSSDILKDYPIVNRNNQDIESLVKLDVIRIEIDPKPYIFINENNIQKLEKSPISLIINKISDFFQINFFSK